MRIALVAPLHESVPPKLYGGTERVVSYLTEELVRMGQDVTLFASGDSVTRAKLHAAVPRGLRLDPRCHDPIAHHFAMLNDVVEASDRFDVIHFHIDYLHYPVTRAYGLNGLTTLHGRLDIPDLVPLYQRYDEMPLVSISDAQRKPLPRVNWVATVHHGLPRDLLPFSPRAGDHLAFLGRISREKRPDRAIRIARRAGMELRIAAKVDKADLAYFESEIKPMLPGGGVEFVGEIGDRDKGKFLGNAAALLCPIDWPEPFGLVMIEAMACGTPVIAWPCGSVPEIIEPGVTGFIVQSEEEAVAALADIGRFDRAACRRAFEARFTSERMARDYLAIYRSLTQPQQELGALLSGRRPDEVRDAS
ncbi:MAG: glycosyltransferase family 4 protein [Bacillota bacterium]